MAIEFKCSTCGKELFAQEQYAGLKTTCPGCQTKMLIPFPNAARDAAAATPETGPAAVKPDEAAVVNEAARVDSDATKRCPFCAETIKAEAKKCRFCGEIIDEDLRREASMIRRRDAADAALTVSRRSDGLWRGLSVLMTMMTAGWLIYLTLDSIVFQTVPTWHFEFRAPWMVYLFNVLMVGGLFALIRQMRAGPFQVFMSAAVAIVVCTPLDVALGLPLQGVENLEELKNNNMFPKTTTPEMMHTTYMILFIFTGMICSLPVWFTALKLAIQARLANRSR